MDYNTSITRNTNHCYVTPIISCITGTKVPPGNPNGWLCSCSLQCRQDWHSIRLMARACKCLDDLTSEKENLRIKWPDDFSDAGKSYTILKFFTREFIPPFEVSDMVNRKTRKITRKTVRKMLCSAIIPVDNF
ncbi:hypothetical protein G9A89_007574 [Geosiphon pyriformis]|nr:hypothetical protein G9A89_007574 [Geosiphon pyriformis]